MVFRCGTSGHLRFFKKIYEHLEQNILTYLNGTRHLVCMVIPAAILIDTNTTFTIFFCA